jgi:hypothetical protein
VPQAALVGNVGVIESDPDSYIRGALNQSIFDGFASDEVRIA